MLRWPSFSPVQSQSGFGPGCRCPSLKSRAESGSAAHPSRVGGMTAPFLKMGGCSGPAACPFRSKWGPFAFLKRKLQADLPFASQKASGARWPPIPQKWAANGLLPALPKGGQEVCQCASVFPGLSDQEGLLGKGFPGKDGTFKGIRSYIQNGLGSVLIS